MQTSKRSIVVFPFRSAAGGQQPRLPACRAWRVVARKAADFAADAPAVAGGVVPAAPAGCADGAYPVWATLTDTESGQRAPAPMLVDGDGWNLAPTGREWTLDYCGGAGADADRLAYVVEVVQDVSECGQVNAQDAAPPPSMIEGPWVSPPTNPVGWTFDLKPPAWARSCELWIDTTTTSTLVLLRYFIMRPDGSRGQSYNSAASIAAPTLAAAPRRAMALAAQFGRTDIPTNSFGTKATDSDGYASGAGAMPMAGHPVLHPFGTRVVCEQGLLEAGESMFAYAKWRP